MSMSTQAIENWLRSISSILTTLSAIFGLPVALLLLLLGPIDQRVDRNTVDLADHGVELARQGQKQARQDTELARFEAELTGFKTELARQGNEQVRQADKFDALSKDFHLFSGEVNIKFAKIDLSLEAMNASKLPVSATPVEQPDNGGASAGGMVWHIPGTIGRVDLISSPEFSGPHSMATHCPIKI